MMNLRVKRVLRVDEIQRHIRLFRVMWERGEPGKPGGGYSAKLSVALTPSLLHWGCDSKTDWLLTVLGLRLHYCRSYGGIFV